MCFRCGSNNHYHCWDSEDQQDTYLDLVPGYRPGMPYRLILNWPADPYSNLIKRMLSRMYNRRPDDDYDGCEIEWWYE
jgi:hypothetical protein